MMNNEEREILETLMMSESFARLSAAVSVAPPIDSDDLPAMLGFCAIDVLKHMDADSISFKTQEAEMHFVGMMAVIFSFLFGGVDNFAAVTDGGADAAIN